nr:MAG TPA: hypothetical protein [Caudoviricetes sp.]
MIPWEVQKKTLRLLFLLWREETPHGSDMPANFEEERYVPL